MIQQFHFWVYTQKKGKQGLRYLYLQVYSNVTHRGQEATQLSTDVNGLTKCSSSTHWNVTQPAKAGKF